MRAIASETKRSHRLPGKLSGRPREKTCLLGSSDCVATKNPQSWRWQKKVKAKMPDWAVVETCPRHSSASNGLAERSIRTIGEQLRTLRYDTQNRYKTRITPESAIWPWMVRYAGFCVMRYARGAGGITSFRAAYDPDLPQETVPFAELVLFKILAPWIVIGKETPQRRHCVGEMDLVRRVTDKPRAHCWDKEWRNRRENFRKAGTDETIRNFIFARDTRCALGLGTKRTASWETQETPDTCTSLTTRPRKPDR